MRIGFALLALCSSLVGAGISQGNPVKELRSWQKNYSNAGVDVYTKTTSKDQVAAAARATLHSSLKDVVYALASGHKDPVKWVPNLRSATGAVKGGGRVRARGNLYGVFRLSSMIWDRDLAADVRIVRRGPWIKMMATQSKDPRKSNLVRVGIKTLEIWARANKKDPKMTDVYVFSRLELGWLPPIVVTRLTRGYWVAFLQSLERTANYRIPESQVQQLDRLLAKARS